MSIKMKDLPLAERPYEKLELYGEKSLSNAELLAIIIKSGTKDETSVQIAQKILNLNYDPQLGDLNFLKDMSLQELMTIKGIGRVKAIQLKALCELVIRMSKPSNYKLIRIKNTDDTAKIFFSELRYEKYEHVKLLLLNNKNEIIKNIEISYGGMKSADADLKKIIGETIKMQVPRIILVHNHPSGDPTPSKTDVEYTKKLYDAAELFDIELLDHIIIGRNGYKSVLEYIIEDKKRF